VQRATCFKNLTSVLGLGSEGNCHRALSQNGTRKTVKRSSRGIQVNTKQTKRKYSQVPRWKLEHNPYIYGNGVFAQKWGGTSAKKSFCYAKIWTSSRALQKRIMSLLRREPGLYSEETRRTRGDIQKKGGKRWETPLERGRSSSIFRAGVGDGKALKISNVIGGNV